MLRALKCEISIPSAIKDSTAFDAKQAPGFQQTLQNPPQGILHKILILLKLVHQKELLQFYVV